MTNTNPGGRAARPGLGRALAIAALPAYLLPAVQAGTTGYLLGNDRLPVAAFTTIAVPSAVAAVGATVVLRRKAAPARPTAASTVQAVALGALLGAAAVAAIVALLIANGLAGTTLLVDAVPSAVVGAGVTAGVWSRSGRPRVRRDSGGRGGRAVSTRADSDGTQMTAVTR